MRKGFLAMTVLFMVSADAASSNPSISYSIETSRFDFVISVSVDPRSPTLQDESGRGGIFDAIVCNQSQIDGNVVANGSSNAVSVAADRCGLFSGVKTLKLEPGSGGDWHGLVYGRFVH